jgi:hypothetical protein
VNEEEEVAPVQIYRLDRPETAAKDNGSKEIQGGDTEGLHVSLIVRASPGYVSGLRCLKSITDEDTAEGISRRPT